MTVHIGFALLVGRRFWSFVEHDLPRPVYPETRPPTCSLPRRTCPLVCHCLNLIPGSEKTYGAWYNFTLPAPL